MESKDGSNWFDFSGTYVEIKLNEFISYILDDGRKVSIKFQVTTESTKVTETFDIEKVNSMELQKAGWQSILNNFKKYIDSIRQ